MIFITSEVFLNVDMISRRPLLHSIADLAHFLKVLFRLCQPLLLEDAVTLSAGTIDEDLLFMS